MPGPLTAPRLVLGALNEAGYRLEYRPTPICPNCKAVVPYSSAHYFGGMNPGYQCPTEQS
jgi:hypothetical protein